MPGYWIYLERQYSSDLVVGPYRSKTIAEHAMENAPIINGLCENDCLECYVTDSEPTTQEIIKADLDDFIYTGLGVDPNVDNELTIVFLEKETKQ